MELQKLNSKIKKVWLIIGIVWSIVFLMIGIGAIAIAYNSKAFLPVVITASLVFLVLCYFFIFFPKLRYKYFSYGYDDLRIYIYSGVIFRHKIVIPVCQIQDLHLEEGPLMRLFNLGGITITTAGSIHLVNGLDIETAKKMVDDLEVNLQKRVEDLKNE